MIYLYMYVYIYIYIYRGAAGVRSAQVRAYEDRA